MSRDTAKFFTRPLALAATALVLHVGAAAAADSKGDIQQQVRELLAGTPATHFAPQSAAHDGQGTTPAVDSQQFVKQLLLGTTVDGVRVRRPSKRAPVLEVSSKSEAQKRHVASVDMRVAVQKMLLGQPYASDAS